MNVPPAYKVIAQYTAVSSIFSLTSLTLYSVSSFVKNQQIAMILVMMQDLSMLMDALVLMVMKIKLVQPSLVAFLSGGSRGGAKNKLKGFLGGSDAAITEGNDHLSDALRTAKATSSSK
ncbi:UNVERIFIED_CONTAM: hypothetical protein HDU68_004906 [Siphonaria sp. JEL0065]|nr:hypothetical protein HDU68_004906 [Siphonaria sp. JEL0065]